MAAALEKESMEGEGGGEEKQEPCEDGEKRIHAAWCLYESFSAKAIRFVRALWGFVSGNGWADKIVFSGNGLTRKALSWRIVPCFPHLWPTVAILRFSFLFLLLSFLSSEKTTHHR